MEKDYSQLTEAELRKIKNTYPIRSREASAARVELTRRAAQNPRNSYSIGSPNPPSQREN